MYNKKVNQALQTKLKTLPRTPGVYFHKSASGEIIYVGKAAVLKNRVRQYFQDSRGRDNKTMALVAEIADTDWIETESEVDALFLESEMVKRYMPRYNVLLRDDKSQMYVRIDMKSEWPTVSFTRNPADDGAEYIGPFYNGFALKKALRYLRRVFPYLTRQRRPGQSKLDEDLGLSPRLSDGSAVYKANLRKLISYIKGNRKRRLGCTILSGRLIFAISYAPCGSCSGEFVSATKNSWIFLKTRRWLIWQNCWA